jgi:hypothetical protein
MSCSVTRRSRPTLTAAPSGDSTAVVAEEVSFGIDRSGT